MLQRNAQILKKIMSEFGIQNGQIITYYYIIEFYMYKYILCILFKSKCNVLVHKSMYHFGNVNNTEFIPSVE